MVEKMKYFLVGKMTGKSLSDYRRALLTAYVIIASIATCLYYVAVNLYRHYNPSLYFYYLFIGVLIACFWLNRVGRHHLAKVIVLLFFNLVVFAFSSREPAVPAAFIFYIISSLVPLAVFDVNEKKSTVFFLLLSLTLYLIARFTEFSLVPSRPIDAEYLVRAYNNNLVIVYVFSVLIIYFLVRINYSVEASLKNREKQIMEKNQVLLKTNEELDRFIYSTSHDLRAPLNSIQGLITLSEMCEDKTELSGYFKMMRERIAKLESVLKEIMEYSKNAKIELEAKEINLREYIDKALSDVQYMEGAERIHITVEVPPVCLIVTDPMRIAIILNNLVSNSIKYSDLTKERPEISITVTRVGEHHVSITIKDNGDGIDLRRQPKIFSMFYRATERSTGSGLGLYLVKETVQKLGGEITFVSELGKGTAFTVVLPSR